MKTVGLVLMAALIVPGLATAQERKDAPALTQETLVGEWAGAVVAHIEDKTEVLPARMHFQKNGTVTITSLDTNKVETQLWRLSKDGNTLEFLKEDTKKVDVVMTDIGMTGKSLSGTIAPPGEAPAGLKIKLYLARVAPEEKAEKPRK